MRRETSDSLSVNSLASRREITLDAAVGRAKAANRLRIIRVHGSECVQSA